MNQNQRESQSGSGKDKPQRNNNQRNQQRERRDSGRNEAQENKGYRVSFNLFNNPVVLNVDKLSLSLEESKPEPASE